MGIFKAAGIAAVGMAVSGACAAATVWESYPPFNSPGQSGIVVGDFDGDGRLDAVVSGLVTSETHVNPQSLIGWLAADGSGTLAMRAVSSLPHGGFFYGRLLLMPREGQSDRIVGVASQDRWSSAANEIVVMGGIPLRILKSLPAPGIVKVVGVADVDADGALEIVALSGSSSSSPQLRVVVIDAASGAVEWTGATDVRDAGIAQLDDDPALEIVLATTPGRIIDGATRQVEWSWPAGFGEEILTGRFANGVSTFAIRRRDDYLVQVFRAQPYSPIGELQMSTLAHNVSVVRYAELDRIALTQSGTGIRIHDPVSGATLFTHGATTYTSLALAVTDLDGDGRSELVYGTSPSSDGIVQVLDMGTMALDYDARAEYGPHTAIAVGDLQGDGTHQVAYASAASGYASGPGLHVVDAATGRRLRQTAGNPGFDAAFGTPRLSIAQMDQDPQHEIIVGGDTGGRPFVAVVDGVTLQEQWRRVDVISPATGSVQAQVVVDADGDGVPDVVIGTSDGRLYVLDGRDGTTLWRSIHISGDTPWSIATLPATPGASRIIASRGAGLYVFDAASGLTQSVATRDTSITALSLWGTGEACRIGTLDAGSLLKVHACTSLDVLHEWTLPPATSFFRALDDDGHRVLTVSGDIVREARRGLPSHASSGYLGRMAGDRNQGEVLVTQDGRHDVIVGSSYKVARVRLEQDDIFGDGFE